MSTPEPPAAAALPAAAPLASDRPAEPRAAAGPRAPLAAAALASDRLAEPPAAASRPRALPPAARLASDRAAEPPPAAARLRAPPAAARLASDRPAVPPAAAARPRDLRAAAPLSRELHLRPPAATDAAALVALVAACDRTYLDWAPAGWRVPEVWPGWPRRLAEPGRWSLCAFRAGELVAYASIRPARRDETPGGAEGPPLIGVAHLAALYVHPACWRQGIGAAMLARAEAAMRGRGYGAARLWTPEGAPAERFYAARGWRRDGRSGWDGWLGLHMVGYATRL